MLPESFFKKPERPKEDSPSSQPDKMDKSKKKKRKKPSKVETEFIHEDKNIMNKLDLALMKQYHGKDPHQFPENYSYVENAKKV